MQCVRGAAIVGVVLASVLAAGGAAAWPGCGCRTGWSGGPRFNGAAPATVNWTQLSVATSATGNSNLIIGSTGPITVTQTSGPVFAYTGGPSEGAINAPLLASLLLGATGQSGAGPSGGGGLINVGSGSSGGLVQTNLGGVTTNGLGTGPVTVGSTGGSSALGGSSAAAGGGAGLQAVGSAVPGSAITAPLPGAAGRTAGAVSSLSPGSSGAGVGTGLGAGSSVQLCASCLTGGVGG